MSGAIIVEPRTVQDFDEVQLKGYGDLVIEQGDEETLLVEAEESLLPRIKTEVRGRRLIIDYKTGLEVDIQTHPIIYHLGMKTIHAVDISGSGSLEASQLQTDQLRLGVSGSGSMEVDDLQADRLTIDISGSAKVDVTGQAAQQDIRISGSGKVQGWGLQSETARLEVSGSAGLTVHAEKELSISVSGVATIEYVGEPHLKQSVSGICNLRNIG